MRLGSVRARVEQRISAETDLLALIVENAELRRALAEAQEECVELRDAAESRIVHRWPDPIGEPITPQGDLLPDFLCA